MPAALRNGPDMASTHLSAAELLAFERNLRRADQEPPFFAKLRGYLAGDELRLFRPFERR